MRFSFSQSVSNSRRMRKIAGIRCFSISSERKLVSMRLDALHRTLETLLLLGHREVRREEEDLEVVARADRVGELPELLVHGVEPPALAGGLEQRPGVDGGDLLHDPA